MKKPLIARVYFFVGTAILTIAIVSLAIVSLSLVGPWSPILNVKFLPLFAFGELLSLFVSAILICAGEKGGMRRLADYSKGTKNTGVMFWGILGVSFSLVWGFILGLLCHLVGLTQYVYLIMGSYSGLALGVASIYIGAKYELKTINGGNHEYK